VSAFAAIVRGDSAAASLRYREVARALSAVYGTAPAVHLTEGCVLLAAPLPGSGDESFAVDAPSGVAAAGHVLLEDREALARELALHADVSALRVAIAAFTRWGEKCTLRFSGEFSFALWDERQRSLLCARDGLGMRQCFVARAADAVVVSNMSSAAIAYPATPRDLDEPSLVRFLASGSMNPGSTAYRAVTPLPPGHTLRLCRAGAELWRHWRFPETGTRLVRDPREAIAGYRAALEAAVRDRLTRPRVSILLSGGIDSGTLAAAARSAAPSVDLEAVTAVYSRAPQNSEVSRARLTADALRIPWRSVDADRHAALHHLGGAWPAPQPMDEPSLTDWRALIAAAASFSTVALYGEDGDSLFLPPGYAALRRASPLSHVIRDTVSFTIENRRLPYLGLRLRERLRIRPAAHRTRTAPTWLTAPARSLLHLSDLPAVLGQRPDPLPPHATRPLAQQRLQVGIADYMAAVISADVTRAPIDLRCPLLDSRVIRFVMNVAPIPWCQGKRLARHAYCDVLPSAVCAHPKRGVGGLDAALARDWQARGHEVPQLPPPLDRWIDDASWRRALHDTAEVGAAWRVLQLAEWLERRGQAGGAPDYLCTA
jgi:asparagine synthase (glutamine-hydrolysing)